MTQTHSPKDIELQSAQTKPAPSFWQKGVATLVVVAVIAVIILALKLAKPQAPEPKLEEKLSLVNTATLHQTSLAPGFTTVGTITASASSDLKSQVNGKISDVFIEAGQRVKAGDLLIQIDPEEQTRQSKRAQANFKLASSNLAQAKNQHEANLKLLEKDRQLSIIAERSLKRYRDLQKRQLATEAQVDQANEVAQRQATSLIQRQTAVANWPAQLSSLEAQLAAAQADFDQAQENLESTQVVAPFSGTISSLMVAPAGRVAPGMSLLTIFDDQQLVLEASIPQNAMIYLQDENAYHKVTAQGKIWGDTVQFQLKAISQAQSASGGTLGLFKAIDSRAPLPINRAMETRVTLPLLSKAYDIPVVSLHDHRYIYLLGENNRLQRQDIELLGETYKGQERRYLISANTIPENAVFVASQMTKNVNGMKVQPISIDQASAE